MAAVACVEEDGGEGSVGATAPVLSKVEVKEYWLRCRLYAEDIELEAAVLTVALVGVDGVSASMKLHSATRMDPYRLEEPPDALECVLLPASESRALFNGGGCMPPEAEGVSGQRGGTIAVSGSLSDRLATLPTPTPPVLRLKQSRNNKSLWR